MRLPNNRVNFERRACAGDGSRSGREERLGMKRNPWVFVYMMTLVFVCGDCAAQSECEKAKGETIKIEECDGSQSDWCVISGKEQCYADQVKEGRCIVGEYSEELKGIVGITPKVLCDTSDGQ